MMHGHFLLIGEEFLELLVSFIRSFRLHYTHAVHHAVDMRIDSDHRQIVEM